MGDRGFDDEEERQKLRNRAIDPELAKRRTPCTGLGVYPWVVERTISSFHQFRRLRVRYDHRDDIHQWALYTLAEILITFRFLDLYVLLRVHHWAGLF